MAKRKRSSAPSSSRARKKADRDAREAENAKRLGKLPREVWRKVLGNLKSDDLFPLALSCRYFLQKIKARTLRREGRQSGKHDRRLALRTNLRRMLAESKPVSAEYVKFCSEEEQLANLVDDRDKLFWEEREKEQKEFHLQWLAAFHGHLPLLQELLADKERLARIAGYSTLPRIAENAARGGQLETLQWLKTQEGFELSVKLYSIACEGGHLEVMKWLRSEGCPWSTGGLGACSRAAEHGHLEILKWLRSEGCRWSKSACNAAAKKGHLEVLKWLRSEGCPWDAWACQGAAEGGHLETLKWLKSEGCPWNAYACKCAAEGGHLEILKWLRSEGCPWDEEACSSAAEGGHLEVLRWLRSQGCPWDERTWKYAADSTRDWLEENGCPQNLIDLCWGDEYHPYSSDDEYSW